MAATVTGIRIGHWSVLLLAFLSMATIISPSEGAAELTDYQKTVILKAHNHFRRIVANTQNAANMRRMEWNDDLADLAAEWVDHCKFEHSPRELRMNRGGLPYAAGENLWLGGHSHTRNLTYLVAAWYNEYRFYDYNTGCKRGAVCGHYTQLIRSETYRVGCALTMRSQCGNVVLFSCNYAPSGLYSWKPYSLGTPCSKCTGNFSNYCIDGLCSETDEIEMTTSTTRLPLIIPNNEEPQGVAFLPWNVSNSEDHTEASGNDTTTSATTITPVGTTLDATTPTTTAATAEP